MHKFARSTYVRITLLVGAASALILAGGAPKFGRR